jgi:hypothetical protein
MPKKKSEHYVNNKELLEALIVYRTKVAAAKEAGLPKPRITNYLGVQYIHNFNPEKSQNPFAYFTQIIHYAFLRRIQKEKKQLEIKTKIIERTGFDEVMTVDDGLLSGSNSDYNTMKDNIQYRNGNR